MIGFVLIFGLIVTGSAIVVTVGQGQLETMATGQQQENGARAMEILATQLDQIRTGDAPSRASTLNLGDGSLRHTDAATLEVTVEDSSGPETQSITTGGLVYRAQDSQLVYENGLVVWQQEDETGGAIRARPPVRCVARDTSNEVLVTGITLDNAGSTQISGGSATVTFDHSETLIHHPTTRTDGAGSASDVSTVYVNVPDSEVPSVWERYFESDDNEWEATTTGSTYDYKCENVGRAYVREVVVSTTISE